MKHWTLCSLLAVCALAFLTAGCVDNSIPDDMPPLPPAQEDVLGGAGTTDLSRGGAMNWLPAKLPSWIKLQGIFSSRPLWG